MRTLLLRSIVVMAIVGASISVLSGQAFAQTATTDLSAAITSNDPMRPSVRLTNVSQKACQVAVAAQGTVAITKVTQGGKTIEPVALDAATDEDIGYLLRDTLQTLQPGASVDIPLQAYKLRSGHVLRATTWSSEGGTFSTQYPVSERGPLQLELSYSVPITPASGAPACGTVLATTVAPRMATPLTAIIVGVLFAVSVAAIVLLMLWLRKRRRPPKPVVAALLLLVLGMGIWWQHPQAAHADVTVPPDMRAAFDSCMGTLNANRDITGPVLDAINNPANHVEIVRTTGGSETTGYRTDSGANFTIYWNPDDRHAYAGTGGNADPCTSLYHEMYHVLDMHNGTFSRADCAGSGIETKEVMATRAQNLLRERLGMPARSHYGDRPLPGGDCTAPPPSGTCTGERCGDTNGDPHLRTFDGLRYDFQAVGEFIAARNPAGTYEIQVRQEPWLESRQVSMNTAVAFRVGKDRVEIRAGKTLALFINGKHAPISAIELPDGGKLEVAGNATVVRWPDGSEAFVRSVGPWGLAISAQPAEAHAGKLEGLLGDADGESKNDLRARASTTTIRPTHKDLYPAFADSWRISDKTSLFTYQQGKRTASYTDHSFPDELNDPKRLPGYAAAERFCKSLGVTDVQVLANCALDMAITGRPEFAKAALHSQTFAAGADFGGTTWHLAIKNPGDTAAVTFDASAGEKIFVAVPTATLPSQCGILRLFTPDGGEITSGCIINGVGNIDGIILPAPGTYTLRLSPHDAVGTATVQLLRITDKQGAISPDGPSITARIDRPGVVGRYTFTAQAGQRVYVDVPGSTLSSQCGILRLLAPDGHELISGCIINGKGNIDTAVLPDTGQYTIVVDPADVVIGQATLRLVFATAESRPITLDGPPLTTHLQKPGSIALFTFSGTAGQRVFIDLPSSELPSQCGILMLKKPDGGTIGSGCIINHKGDLNDDGVILPATGQYTIVLDPGDAATGKTTIRLRSR